MTSSILTIQQRQQAAAVVAVLKKHQPDIHPVLAPTIQNTPPLIFDFSETNQTILGFDFHYPEQMDQYLKEQMAARGSQWGIGKYTEDRVIYRQSPLFNNGVDEPRSLHLAYDLWAPAGTPLFAPLSARVHSFANNDRFLDYGGTIILEHELEGVVFYTLYGHLSHASVNNMSLDMTFHAGEKIGEIGTMKENGNWATHLHFQIITDMLGMQGDFPGVAKLSEREFWTTICPDPALIVRY